MDNLEKRGLVVLESNACVLCARSLWNQLFTYSFTALWPVLFGSIVSVGSVSSGCFLLTVAQLFLGWWIHSSRSLANKVWKLVPHVIFWLVWKERTSRIFDGKEKDITHLLNKVHNLFFSWTVQSAQSSRADFFNSMYCNLYYN